MIEFKILHVILIAGIAAVSLAGYQQFLFLNGSQTSKDTGTKTNFSYPDLKNFSKEELKQTVIQMDKTCSTNSECSWQITNCCTENAGAQWSCINQKKSVVKCENLVLCPQVLSPKPSAACECVSGACAIK